MEEDTWEEDKPVKSDYSKENGWFSWESED
jgi:hypothetical protein